MTLPVEGYRSRVSDHVNRRDQEFFTIIDAQLVAIDGSGRDWDTPVLMLARRHIRLIVPASDGRIAAFRPRGLPAWPACSMPF